MGSISAIEWTQRTWNPLRGCRRVSPGCKYCYAERMAARFSNAGQAFHGFAIMTDSGPLWTGRAALVEDKLDEPFSWKKPSIVFVNSMSDLFHEDLTIREVYRIFAVMELCARHTYQVLTKRAERLEEFVTRIYGRANIGRILPNVWLGVSVEDRKHGLPRIEHLRRTPAAVRFLSIEPLLEDLGQIDLTGIHWVIVGGESGPGARPMHPEWARSIRDQCIAAGVPFFFKQWGSWAISRDPYKGVLVRAATDKCGYYCDEDLHVDHREVAMVRTSKKLAGRLLDGREWNQMPRGSPA